MSVKKHLFIGFGQLASRCAARMAGRDHMIVGISRSQKPHDSAVSLWVGDLKSGAMLDRLSETYFDTVSITLTPDAYNEAAYYQTYVEAVDALTAIWQNNNAPGRIVFVSSTSVYGQSQGEWVNEQSVAEPHRPSAKMLREAELRILRHFEQAVVVRFSGIYGEKRDFLLRQVRDQKAGDENYTNRIHEADCCGVICHLLTLPNIAAYRVVLASDCCPVSSQEIRQWLAGELNVELSEVATQTSRGGNKRCDNRLLLQSGYKFMYPTYKEGYQEGIKRFLLNADR